MEEKTFMKFYKFALWKAYFDKGYGITSYFKYLIAIIGITGYPAKFLIPIFFIYGISCFAVGWLWYHYKITDAENEVQNVFNPFVNQMRRKFSLPAKRKSI